MNLEKRLDKRTPDTSGIAADNADLILERIEVLDPGPASVKKLCVGILRARDGQSWYSAHNLQYNNYLRSGAYKVRMFTRPSTHGKVLQVAAPFWGAILVHPTSNWRTLEGCISPIHGYFEDPIVIFGSHEAHNELMDSLGTFQEHKEFTLWVENNPSTKPGGDQATWFNRKRNMKLARMKKKG